MITNSRARIARRVGARSNRASRVERARRDRLAAPHRVLCVASRCARSRRHSMTRLRIFEFARAPADETRRARIRARVVAP
jgi:hypothetical protein